MLIKASQVCDSRIQQFSIEFASLLLKYNAELYSIGGGGLMLLLDDQAIPQYNPKNYLKEV